MGLVADRIVWVNSAEVESAEFHIAVYPIPSYLHLSVDVTESDCLDDSHDHMYQTPYACILDVERRKKR